MRRQCATSHESKRRNSDIEHATGLPERMSPARGRQRKGQHRAKLRMAQRNQLCGHSVSAKSEDATANAVMNISGTKLACTADHAVPFARRQNRAGRDQDGKILRPEKIRSNEQAGQQQAEQGPRDPVR